MKNQDIMNARLGYISRNDRVVFPGGGDFLHPGLGNDVSTGFVSEDLVVSDIALGFLKDQNFLVDDSKAEELIINTIQSGGSSSTTGSSSGAGTYADPYTVTGSLTATLSVVDSADLDAAIDSDILAEVKSAVDYWAGALAFPNDTYKDLEIFVFIEDDITHRSCENSRLSYTYTLPTLQGTQISISTSFPHIISIFLDRNLINFWKGVRTDTNNKRIQDFKDGKGKSNFYHIIRREILKGFGIGPYWITYGCESKDYTSTTYIDLVNEQFYWNGPAGLAAYNTYIQTPNSSGIPFEYRSRKPSGGSSCLDICLFSQLEGGFLIDEVIPYDGASRFYETPGFTGALPEGEMSQASIYVHDKDFSLRPHGYAVSGITLGVLDDMGWDVDYTKAEEYNDVTSYTP